MKTRSKICVDVLQLHLQIERIFDRLPVEHAHHVGVGQQQLLEVFLLVVRAERVALHPFVGLLARNAPLRELEQHGSREHDAARQLEVLLHAIDIHDEALHDAREPPQHVIERDEAVRKNHALDRRVRDVALVPERDVLERRVRVAPQQPREAGNLLAADGIALVRHRRRALLPLAERLLHLADFGFLQPAHFERELLERRAGDGNRRHQLGVTIALNDLRRHRRRLQSELPADGRFDGRIEVRERADGARDFPDRDDGPRALQPLEVALQLGVPERQLQAERHRLGVHAVRASHHRRAAMLFGPRAHGVEQTFDVLDEQVGRLAHLNGLRGVDDVGRRQPEVQPARRRPDVLGNRGRKRDDVVLSGFFDGRDAGDVELRFLSNVARGIVRNDSSLGHRLGSRNFNLQPGLESPLFAPDAPHVGVCVARNH